MGCRHISGSRAQDLLVLAQHHIQDKVDPADSPGLLDVHTQGISFQISGAGLRAHHHGVIRLNGRPCGAARHDRLSPAGIAGEIMVLHIPQADPPIRLGHNPCNIHRGSRLGDAQVHAIGRIAVHAADLPPGPLPRQAALLLIALMSVAAQGKDQRDILRPDPRGIELIQQRGHHLGRGHGPGQIAGDDGNSLAGMKDLPQARRSHRLPQGPAHFFLLRGDGGGRVCPQHPHQVLLGQLHSLHTAAHSEFQLHFVCFLFTASRAARVTCSAVRPKRCCR